MEARNAKKIDFVHFSPKNSNQEWLAQLNSDKQSAFY